MSKEIWKPVVGFEGYYEVSTEGRVRSISRTLTDSIGRKTPIIGRVIKCNVKRNGYVTVGLSKGGKVKTELVHRVVAKAHIENVDNLPCVNHKDLDKTNNSVSNLEWCTYSENSQHYVDNNTEILCGENSRFSVISQDTAVAVCELLQDGWRNVDIAKHLNISKSTVSSIKTRSSWTEVSKEYTFTANKRGISSSTVRWICESLQKGLTGPEILKMCTNPSIKLTHIYSIRKRQHYQHISKDYVWPKHRSKFND